MDQTLFMLASFFTRGISWKEIRVDRIMEGSVCVQEYKNSVNPGAHNLHLEGYL